ncbi:hypothetical protein F511_09059 [Dorcoceras hygrometricum]|uniref:Uncharacterized protein n=1 Tax=Dorcoceras hygrometricum TaxID=472368 RepID=A0A2Z7AT51_9LAMI|nr:hypothetical protein F511_09059 [Dorcoceras hygrometricum]
MYQKIRDRTFKVTNFGKAYAQRILMPTVVTSGPEVNTRPASRAMRLELGDPEDMCSVREYCSKTMPYLPESSPYVKKKNLQPTSARCSRAPDVVVLARRLG